MADTPTVIEANGKVRDPVPDLSRGHDVRFPKRDEFELVARAMAMRGRSFSQVYAQLVLLFFRNELDDAGG
jgi:hypothetical protein